MASMNKATRSTTRGLRQQVGTVVLLLVALGLAGGGGACASDSVKRDERRLSEEVRTQVEKSSAPAVVAHSVMATTSRGGEYYDPRIPMRWTLKIGVNVLHLSSDALEHVETLTAENLVGIRKSVKSMELRSGRVRLNTSAETTKGFASGLKGLCFTEFSLQMAEERLITMSSGPMPILIKDACELSAQVFAVQGIRLAGDPRNPTVITLTLEQ